jgi:hypothetical protein
MPSTPSSKLLCLNPVRSFNDQRIAIAPVLAVAGEQADTIMVSLNE